jgi:hypothetical protein
MAELTLKQIEAAMKESGIHVLSIRPTKKGFSFNFRISDFVFAKPENREYPTIEEGLRSFFKFKEPPSEDLEDLLG